MFLSFMQYTLSKTMYDLGVFSSTYSLPVSRNNATDTLCKTEQARLVRSSINDTIKYMHF